MIVLVIYNIIDKDNWNSIEDDLRFECFLKILIIYLNTVTQTYFLTILLVGFLSILFCIMKYVSNMHNLYYLVLEQFFK